MTIGIVSYLLAGATSMLQLWILGRIIDEGIVAGDARNFISWMALMLLAVLVQPLFWSAGFRRFVGAEAATQRTVLRRLTDHLNTAGTGVRGRVSTGELVNLVGEDTRRAAGAISEIGLFFNSFAMFAVGSILVWSIHPLLGAVIVTGSVFTSAATGPILRRLQRRRTDYRAQVGDLTAQAADIVGGLRVLRGIGGDFLFAARYRERSAALQRTGFLVANSTSWIHALQYSMPILFVAAITWTGALLAANGAITIGGLASAFSFATFFIAVSGGLIGAASFLLTSLVAAERITRFLAIEPDIGDTGTVCGPGGDLYDPDTDLTVPAGGLTVVVADATAPALAACERLARYRDSEAVWGTTLLDAYALEEVRERIMLLTDEDRLFAATLGETLRVEPSAALAAIETACAADVYTGLGGTLEARITEGGRNLSGGQRQRLLLARALAAAPETLLAVEPTSAVDSHTESLIAERVAITRTLVSTLVVTNSPLWLAHADHVVWMVEGKVHATGSHAELLDLPAYRILATHSADR
ncbi:ABC transporter ATP-binding protein [Glycomyces lechevalierae]|uniref:ABC transporter ATP-binding protein n=2 Tax=Glycomyces TaxID=58113 RepID=A0A9X3PID0_9ACTN|nr:ABC transporter ATP-binding protein [Glycomyces lechevalierae]MDA1386046.1 ABC transporter ATP-binding protein [Glycomyces lechevalierae]